MRRPFVFLWIGIFLLLLFVFFYLPGLSRYHELKREEERLAQELQKMAAQREKLEEEKKLLQNDVAYLEKVIREELGLVKPGETIYKLVPDKKPAEN